MDRPDLPSSTPVRRDLGLGTRARPASARFVRATHRPHRHLQGPLGSIPSAVLAAKMRSAVDKVIEQALAKA